MEQVFYHRYERSFFQSAKKREGCLLKVYFKAWGWGYADCAPIPTLGDKSVSDHLTLLKCGKSSDLLRASLYFAEVDAKARARKRSLFEGLQVPASHYSLHESRKVDLEEIQKKGFEEIKVKIRPDENLNWLSEHLAGSSLKWRIDANNRFDLDQAKKFLDSLAPESLESIEFLEDLCPYDDETWKNIRQDYGVSLARDHRLDEGFLEADVLVFKPAVEDMAELLQPRPETERKRYVITNYLDHPVGQAFAAWTAARYKVSLGEELLSCGLLTERLFENGEEPPSPNYKVPEGFGIGFDLYLEGLQWQSL